MRINPNKLAAINPWHFVWISVLISELFTMICNTVQSLLWWDHISYDLLLIGTIDAFFVSLVVAALVIYFIRHTSTLSQQNANLSEQIDQRKNAERALKGSEEKYRMVADNLRDSIWTVGLDSLCFTYLSPSVEWMLGFSPEELLGRPMREVVTPESFERCFTNLQQELAWEAVAPLGPQASRVMEAEHVCRDGSRFWAEVTVTVARDDQGNPINLLGVSRDITDRRKAEFALRESEKRLRLITDNLPVLIAYVDAEQRYRSVNREYENWFGIKASEILGRKVVDIVGPKAYVNLRSGIEAALAGEAAAYESRITLSDGSTKDFFSRNIPHFDEYGKIPGYFVLVQDMTEFKKAEQALRDSEIKYRELVENIDQAIFALDNDGRIVYISPVIEDILRYKPEEMVGLPYVSFVHPDDLAVAEKQFQDAISGQWYPKEWRIFNKDGQIRWVQSHSKPSVRDGRVVSIQGILSDITERKQADAALRKSEKKYRDLFDNISDCIYTHDLEGRFLSANRALYETLGYTEEETIGRMISDFISPDYATDFHDYYLPHIRTQGHDSGILFLINRNGQPRYLEYRNSLVKGNNSAVYVRGSGRDVTDRIHIVQEKRLLEKQLLQAQKMEAVGTLASGVAHDFNNILQVASGYLQIIKSGQAPGPTHKKYLSEMESALHRAAVLVRQLLTLSRKSTVNLTPLDLTDVVRQTVSMLYRTMPKTIVLDTQLADEPCIIKGDPNQLDQILLNLATNAVDAMDENGTLVIETLKVTLDEAFSRTHFQAIPGDYVLLRVSDNGAGMDPETINHVFEPFFTTKQPGRGTGLGLSTVYSLVKKYSGFINCYSEPGLGTTFNLYFPAVKSAMKKESEAAGPATPIQGGSETILLVDDEMGILELGRLMLQSYGYTVITAEDGLNALEVYKSHASNIDLVLLDLGMPKMSGQRCLGELLKINSDLKVVVASGYSLQGPAKGILEAGAKGYVSKPYQMAEMMTIVREVLDAKTDGQASPPVGK